MAERYQRQQNSFRYLGRAFGLMERKSLNFQDRVKGNSQS